MKIVINTCFGGFGLSEQAREQFGSVSTWKINRTDPRLVALVEADSAAASGPFAKLRVVEIPDEATDWEIREYDGVESIAYVKAGKLYWAG